MMPLILLGIGSLILALSFKSLSILVFAVINVIIAGGDLIIAFSIRKVTKRSLVIDHPYEAGFVAFQE